MMIRHVLLLFVFCLLSGCTGTTFTWNSELTLHFKTPNGPIVESSVTLNEYWICDRRCINPGHTGTTVSSRTYGEAIAARLGDTYVFALVSGAAHGRQAHLDAFADRGLETQRQWIKAITRNRDVVAVVPRKLYPKLVAFKDITDPTSIYQIDPSDLPAALGPGYALEKVTVRATDKPMTTGVIDPILPWVETAGPNLLGENYDRDRKRLLLAATTGRRHFKSDVPK
jgi:hypothetical protein